MQQTVNRQTQRQVFKRNTAQQQQAAPTDSAQQQGQHQNTGQDRPQQRAGAHQRGQQRDHNHRRHRQEVAQPPDVSHHIAAQHPQRLSGQQLPVWPQPHQQRNHQQRADRPQPRPGPGGRQLPRQHRSQQPDQPRLKSQPDNPPAYRSQQDHRQPLADNQLTQRTTTGTQR